MCHRTQAAERLRRSGGLVVGGEIGGENRASPRQSSFLRGKTFNRRPPTTSLASLINVHGRRHRRHRRRLAPSERSAAAEAEAARRDASSAVAVTTENNVFTTACGDGSGRRSRLF